jgi:hypothetical protein
MSVDLQVAYLQQNIELFGVRVLPGMSPRTLDCSGRDFRQLDEILINGVISPEVVVVSTTRALARVPDTLVNQTISSVTAVSNEFVASDRSLVRFRLGRTPNKVNGLLKLMQVFLKILFTRPGTDIFSPAIGGNALRNIGTTFGKDQGGTIISDFIVSVSNTQRQLLAIQSRDPSLPLNERLLAAKVTSAGFNRNEAALVVSTEITSQAGRAAVANLAI